MSEREPHREGQRTRARYEEGIRHVGTVSALLGGFSSVILGAALSAKETDILFHFTFVVAALSAVFLLGAALLSSYLFFISKERDLMWNSDDRFPLSPFIMAFGRSDTMMLCGVVMFFVTICLLSWRMGLATGLVISLVVVLLLAGLLQIYRSLNRHVDKLDVRQSEGPPANIPKSKP